MITEADGFRWAVDSVPADYMGASHEAGLDARILALLPPGGVFLDIGAHVGHYTLRASRIASKVIAVEANPDTAGRLRENLDLNGITGVTVHNVAAWDSRAMLRLQDPNGQVRGGSTRVLPAGEPGPGTIPATPLDELLAGESRIDLVKLDVEGADLHALRGMAATLARLRPVMIVEDHSIYGYYRREDLLGLLAGLGYCSDDFGSYGGAGYFLALPGAGERVPVITQTAGHAHEPPVVQGSTARQEMRTMTSNDLFVAVKVAAVGFEGRTVMLEPGMVVRAGHPLLQGREELFEPLRVDFEVEQEVPKAALPPAEPKAAPAAGPAQARKPGTAK